MNRFKATTADSEVLLLFQSALLPSPACVLLLLSFRKQIWFATAAQSKQDFSFVCLCVVCLGFVLFYYGKGARQNSKSTNLFGDEKPLMRAPVCEGGMNP